MFKTLKQGKVFDEYQQKLKNKVSSSSLALISVGKLNIVNNLNLDMKKFHIIIGATNGISLLTLKHVNNFCSNVLVLDIGKGILKVSALRLALIKKINLYRLDVTPAYNAYLENITTTQKLYNLNLKRSLIHRNFKLVKRGMLSDENSIIVDNVNSPKKIYGISDGYGSFKKIHRNTLKNLQKKIISKY